MSLIQDRTTASAPQRTGKRSGYLVSIAINAAMLYVINNVVEWGWFAWLTSDFDDVVPWISFSIIAALMINAVYLSYDRPAFKALTQSALNVIAFVVLVRVYRTFPFDFTAYDLPWTGFSEALLIIGMVGSAIGATIEAGKFLVRINRSPSWDDVSIHR